MNRKHKVCMYLPPFAGDYSGVCSALFDLGGMICIHDAAGCTGNYTHFDEPRWYGSHSMVYCTSLRKVDAILGDDEKLIGKITKNALERHPKFIAIVGSPVPNVIGFDFNGVARAVETRTGIPCFGFPTAGIKGSYYDGILMAYSALTEYYERNPEKRDPWNNEGTIAVPGISPLDMHQEVFDSLCETLAENGISLMQGKGLYGSLLFYQYPEKVTLNLVWNQAGLAIAKEMEKKYQTPYIVNFPIGQKQMTSYLDLVKEGKTAVFKVLSPKNIRRSGVIIADSVIGDSVRNFLRAENIDCQLYTIEHEDDVSTYLNDEDAILSVVKDQEDLLIADPLFMEFSGKAKNQVLFPQYSVSSRVGKGSYWNYLDENKWLELNL